MSNTSNASSRNTITCPSSGNGTTTPITFSTSSPDRACNYIAIDDLAAYLDWAALRLMTELEFEKACRGPEYPAVDECAWGNNSWTNITGFNGTDGSGTETKTPANANTHINNSSNVNGPVRVGIFAASEDGNGYTRQNAGASYWGIMELSGNVYERVISVGNNHGRGYDGTLGDGELNSSGNANASTWYPAIYDQAYRGGDFYSPIIHSIVGDRSYGSFINTARSPSGGGRGVRP
jgi:formylglycine-generating enzyme required for sulfatase activity